jgi:hypothetical protein
MNIRHHDNRIVGIERIEFIVEFAHRVDFVFVDRELDLADIEKRMIGSPFIVGAIGMVQSMSAPNQSGSPMSICIKASLYFSKYFELRSEALPIYKSKVRDVLRIDAFIVIGARLEPRILHLEFLRRLINRIRNETSLIENRERASLSADAVHGSRDGVDRRPIENTHE